jgi:serine/threonine-protein kinase
MRGQLPIGSVLAGYRIIELIGEGAGAAVYLAEQAESGERVALKVLADELAHDDLFRRRFLRESTIAARRSSRSFRCGFMSTMLRFGFRSARRR